MIKDEMNAKLRENDETIAHLRVQVERLTRERDNAITKCYELENQVSDYTVKAKTAERERDEKDGFIAALAKKLQTEMMARESAERQVATLREALKELISACDKGRLVEHGVGGMTLESQMRRSVLNGVPAWPVEEARAALAKAKS